MRKYSLDNINEIIENNNFEMCLCANEKNGEEAIGFVTIQVGHADGEYFGEFYGKTDEDLEFFFYI